MYTQKLVQNEETIMITIKIASVRFFDSEGMTLHVCFVNLLNKHFFVHMQWFSSCLEFTDEAKHLMYGMDNI